MELKKGDNFLGWVNKAFPNEIQHDPMQTSEEARAKTIEDANKGLEEPIESKILKGVVALMGGYQAATAVPGILGLVGRMKAMPEAAPLVEHLETNFEPIAQTLNNMHEKGASFEDMVGAIGKRQADLSVARPPFYTESEVGPLNEARDFAKRLTSQNQALTESLKDPVQKIIDQAKDNGTR